MIILRFVFLCLLFIHLAAGSRVGNRINVAKVIKEYSQRENDAETSVDYNDSLNDQNSKLKLKEGLRRKRLAILPTILQGSLDTGLIPAGMDAQLGPAINLQLNRNVPKLKEQNGILGALDTITNPIQMFGINCNDVNNMLSDTKNVKAPYGILFPISNNGNGDNYIDSTQSNDRSQNLNELSSVGTESINNTNVVNPVNQSDDIINKTDLGMDNEKSMNFSTEQNGTFGIFNAVTDPVKLLIINPKIINAILNDTKNAFNGDNSTESPEINSVKTTSIYNASIINSINKPFDVIKNSALPLDNDKSLQALAEQNDIPAAFSIVSYPVQLFVINPNVMNKKLSDFQMKDLKFSILNTIHNNKNGYINNKTSEVDNSVTNKMVNSLNNTHDIANIIDPQTDYKKSLNNLEEKDHATLLNTSNKTNILLADQTDDTILENYETMKNNKMDEPLLHNNPNGNNNNLENESQPSPLITNNEEWTQNKNYNPKPTNTPIKLLTHYNQNVYAPKYEGIGYDPKKYLLGSNINNFKFVYDNNNKPVSQHFYPPHFEYQYLKPVPKYLAMYNNKMLHINNDNMNNIMQYNGNMRPDYKYQKEDACQYQKGENIPININPDLTHTLETFNTIKENQHNELENIAACLLKKYKNNDIQNYTNMGQEFKYPLEYQNINTQNYGRPEFLLDNHRADNIFNDTNEVYKKNMRAYKVHMSEVKLLWLDCLSRYWYRPLPARF